MSEKYYYWVMNPSAYADIVSINAREKWKEQSHRKRWELRYQKPYPEIICETGNFYGISFYD